MLDFGGYIFIHIYIYIYYIYIYMNSPGDTKPINITFGGFIL